VAVIAATDIRISHRIVIESLHQTVKLTNMKMNIETYEIKMSTLVISLVCMFFIPVADAFEVIDSDPDNKACLKLDYPDFGSGAASIRHYDLEASSIVPSNVITEAGQSLAGIGAVNLITSDIGVKDIGDNIFALLIADRTQDATFPACYDEFAVFALDLDGDGFEEILVEHGRGQGTCVYRRYLSIYKNKGSGLQLTKRIKLSEWYWHEELKRPVAWAKGYAIVRDESGGVIIKISSLGKFDSN